MATHGVIEGGQSRPGRWLRERRFRLAIWIALVEGLLVLVHVIPRWPALGLAIAIVLAYFWAGRSSRQAAIREAGWILAVSQSLVLLVPVFAFLFWTVALIGVVILGIVALFVLFTDR